ncbi:MAG: hypothetical protein JWM40_1372 [Frankiales bacterium]|nr:hypothetical protein [Frankiales bacterium]
MTTVQIKVVDEDVMAAGGEPGMSALLDVEQLDTGDRPPSRFGSVVQKVTQPFVLLRAVPHVVTYIGMLLTLAGGVLLVVAWSKTAALTNVGLQMPFVLSAGCTGLGLVAVGLTVVNVAAKTEDADKRRAQLGELRDLLGELRRAVESDGTS